MMFAQLTDAQNATKSVWINPDQVVYVQTVGGKTWIATTALNGSGGTRVFIVEEEETVAVAALSRAQDRRP